MARAGEAAAATSSRTEPSMICLVALGRGRLSNYDSEQQDCMIKEKNVEPNQTTGYQKAAAATTAMAAFVVDKVA